MDQNDDFYVVVPSNASTNSKNNDFSITFPTHEPIVLDKMRKWRVALVDLTFPSFKNKIQPETEVVIEEKCYNHTTIEVPILTLNYEKVEITTIVTSTREENDLNLGPYKVFWPPKFSLNESKQVILSSRQRFDVLNEKDVQISTHAWNKETQMWDMSIPEVKTKEGEKGVQLRRLKFRVRSPEFTVITHKKVASQKFGTQQDMVEVFSKLFENHGLEIGKFQDHYEVRRIQFHRKNKHFEDWRDVVHIGLKNEEQQLSLNNDTNSISWFKAMYAFFLSRPPTHLLVFSNIITPLRIGMKREHLLRSICVADAKQTYNMSSIDFKQPMFIPLQETTITNIEILIKTIDGVMAPFIDDGETTATLHFKSFS
jgi:hypothetical protein